MEKGSPVIRRTTGKELGAARGKGIPQSKARKSRVGEGGGQQKRKNWGCCRKVQHILEKGGGKYEDEEKISHSPGEVAGGTQKKSRFSLGGKVRFFDCGEKKNRSLAKGGNFRRTGMEEGPVEKEGKFKVVPLQALRHREEGGDPVRKRPAPTCRRGEKENRPSPGAYKKKKICLSHRPQEENCQRIASS